MAYDPHRKRAASKADREHRRKELQEQKRARRYAKVKQSPSLWPDAPADVAGVARTLSNGGPL